MARKVEPGASAKSQSEEKKPAAHSPARKVSSSKASPSKTPVKKTPVTKTSAQKSAAAKTPVKKTPAKKAAAKVTQAPQAAAPKAPAKKKPAKKTTAAKTPAVPKSPGKKAPTTRKPVRTMAERRVAIRRQLALMSSPAEDALVIEAQNRRYYDAFQALDLERLGHVWWRDDSVSCVHPGWDMRRGWPAVRGTYEEIFQSTRSIRFALGDVRVRVVGDLGYVTCVENLVSDEGDHGDYLGAVLATNIFERRQSEWRLVHHHASPFSVDEMTLPQGPLH